MRAHSHARARIRTHTRTRMPAHARTHISIDGVSGSSHESTASACAFSFSRGRAWVRVRAVRSVYRPGRLIAALAALVPFKPKGRLYSRGATTHTDAITICGNIYTCHNYISHNCTGPRLGCARVGRQLAPSGFLHCSTGPAFRSRSSAPC